MCVANCSGQAIFLVNEDFAPGYASIGLPYEFLPLPQAGDKGTALGRDGQPVCEAEVISVRSAPVMDKTNILTMKVPVEYVHQARFFQALLDEVKKRNTAQLPVVLMAHLSIEGSDRSGHDESIGGIEYVPLSAMGEGYDYLALGHIHCPQDIKGSHHHARYCGTPLPVSFDETYPHSVSIIELEKGAEPQISTREIENPIPLVTLPHDPTPFEDALKLLEEYPEEKPAYLRLNVLTTRERQADTDESKPISIQEMQEMSPLEIARLYYRETEGEEMDPELCQLMETVMQKVKSKNNS